MSEPECECGGPLLDRGSDGVLRMHTLDCPALRNDPYACPSNPLSKPVQVCGVCEGAGEVTVNGMREQCLWCKPGPDVPIEPSDEAKPVLYLGKCDVCGAVQFDHDGRIREWAAAQSPTEPKAPPTEHPAIKALVKRWRAEARDYPASSEGEHAAAAVRLCARELESALEALMEDTP